MTLSLQTIDDKDVESAINSLKKNNLLIESDKCPLCEENITNIGGFLPKSGKVMPICDKIKCILEASYSVMKHNGNGSPIIE